MNFPADAYPITIPQGTDYEKVFTYYPSGTDAAVQDWTGWTGAAQLRRRIEDTTALATFVVTLGGVAGTVTIALAHATTAALDPGRAYYDVELTKTSTGAVMRFVGGKAQITAEVTR